jgi:hypothetical protein
MKLNRTSSDSSGLQHLYAENTKIVMVRTHDP